MERTEDTNPTRALQTPTQPNGGCMFASKLELPEPSTKKKGTARKLFKKATLAILHAPSRRGPISHSSIKMEGN